MKLTGAIMTDKPRPTLGLVLTHLDDYINAVRKSCYSNVPFKIHKEIIAEEKRLRDELTSAIQAYGGE